MATQYKVKNGQKRWNAGTSKKAAIIIQDRRKDGCARTRNGTIMRLNEPSPDLASQSWSSHDGHDA